MSAREKLKARLGSYWKLEIANVLIVPACMIFLPLSYGTSIGWISYICFVPMCGLLLIGGLYWRAKLAQLNGDKTALPHMLKHAHIWQTPLLITTLLACALCLAGWGIPNLARSMSDKLVATIAAVLAALEYVNYYKRQVQHFDHVADFKKLLLGKGFRPSQMAVDLRRWREKRGADS